MSKFSMKPQQAAVASGEGSGASKEEWQAWNEYLYSLIEGKETEVKEGKFVKKADLVGILNLMVDVGFQPQADGEYDTKVAVPDDGEEFSQEEREYMDKYPGSGFIWTKDKSGKRVRKQTNPQRPVQEYYFAYDFPDLMVDYTQHPIEDVHKLGSKPLRVSPNGKFRKGDFVGFNRQLRFQLDRRDNTLSTKNPIYKIADASGCLKEFLESEYDLGELAGTACEWTVIMEKRVDGDRTYYNTRIQDPSFVADVRVGNKVVATREDRIPSCDVEFMGVLLDQDEYSPEALEIIKNKPELLATLKRCVEFWPNKKDYPDFSFGTFFKDTKLAAALGMAGEASDSSSEEESSPKQGGSTGVGEKQAENSSEEDDSPPFDPDTSDDFDFGDDDIPY